MLSNGADYVHVYSCSEASCSSPVNIAALQGVLSGEQWQHTVNSGYTKVTFSTDSDHNTEYSGFSAVWGLISEAQALCPMALEIMLTICSVVG